MSISKSSNFQFFCFGNNCVWDLDLLHHNKIKWIYANISLVHLLHQIGTDIYIFNKIFTEHKLAHLQGLRGVKDTIA
jgi:hypothetical protein